MILYTKYSANHDRNTHDKSVMPENNPRPAFRDGRAGRAGAGGRYIPAHTASSRREKQGGSSYQTVSPHKRTPVHAAPARRTRRAAYRRKRRMLHAGAMLLCAILFVLVLGAFGKKAEAAGSESSDVHMDPAFLPHEGPPYTIAIDAGHGGSDVGAEGIVDEKIMTETTIRALEQWLEQDENYTPVRTHAQDTFATPKERAEAANEAHAALLISVHGNSAPGYPDITGFECYPQPPGRAYHDDSLRIAHQIADRFGTAGQRLRGEAGVRYLYYEGDDINGYEKKIIEESDCGMRSDPTFGILEHAECPAVLAEQCFVTSSTDTANWAGETGSARAARIYYEAICEFFGTQPIKLQ